MAFHSISRRVLCFGVDQNSQPGWFDFKDI